MSHISTTRFLANRTLGLTVDENKDHFIGTKGHPILKTGSHTARSLNREMAEKHQEYMVFRGLILRLKILLKVVTSNEEKFNTRLIISLFPLHLAMVKVS